MVDGRFGHAGQGKLQLGRRPSFRRPRSRVDGVLTYSQATPFIFPVDCCKVVHHQQQAYIGFWKFLLLCGDPVLTSPGVALYHIARPLARRVHVARRCAALFDYPNLRGAHRHQFIDQHNS